MKRKITWHPFRNEKKTGGGEGAGLPLLLQTYYNKDLSKEGGIQIYIMYI